MNHLLSLAALCLGLPALAAEPFKLGIIGLDTSHVVAFTKEFHNPSATGDLAGFKVVAAFPGGSPDIPKDSTDRIPGYIEQLKKLDVEIVDSIPALLARVDGVLLESVDGRPHLEQAKPVIAAKKPLYIDKPLAGSLADAIAIAELAKPNNVPFFSSSSLRFGPKLHALKSDPKVGQIMGVDAFSPCSLEPHHPDLFWYGVHGVETLYTLMGPGCQTVQRAQTDGADVVVGIWKDGRIGTFRGTRDSKHDYGAVVFGKAGVGSQFGFEGYKPLVEQIGKFFKTGKPPIAPEETLEILAFMEAADESKRQNGAPIKLADVMQKAKEAAQSKLK